MGTWGTDLFADDLARDIRDDYREQIEDGVEDAEATRSTFLVTAGKTECGGMFLTCLKGAVAPFAGSRGSATILTTSSPALCPFSRWP